VRVKILRCELANGSGAAGDLLDDRLTVACKQGAIRILELQRAGQGTDEGGGFSARNAAEASDAATLDAPLQTDHRNMTVRRSGGWQLRKMEPRCRRAGNRDQGDLRRAGSRSMAPAAPTPACTHWPSRALRYCQAFRAGRFRDGLNAHLRPHPDRRAVRRKLCPIHSRRGSPRRSGIILSHRQSPRQSGARNRPRLAAAETARYRRHACRCAAVGRQARFHHVFATPNARRSRRRKPSTSSTSSETADAVHIVTSARSFLHSQVRSMVGSLVWVGEGGWSADDLAAALAARNPRRLWSGRAADGLYLVRVDY